MRTDGLGLVDGGDGDEDVRCRALLSACDHGIVVGEVLPAERVDERWARKATGAFKGDDGGVAAKGDVELEGAGGVVVLRTKVGLLALWRGLLGAHFGVHDGNAVADGECGVVGGRVRPNDALDGASVVLDDEFANKALEAIAAANKGSRAIALNNLAANSLKGKRLRKVEEREEDHATALTAAPEMSAMSMRLSGTLKPRSRRAPPRAAGLTGTRCFEGLLGERS